MGARSLSHAFQRVIAAIVTTAVVIAMTQIVTPAPVRALSAEQLALRDGLQDVSDALAGLDGLDELAQSLPLSGLLPTGNDGLDAADSVKAVLDDAIQFLDANSVDGALEDALNALDGTSVGAGVTAHVTADVTDDHVTFSELSFTRASTTELVFATPELSLDGAQLDTSLSLSFTANGDLEMLLDTSGAPELYLPDTAPNAALTAQLALDVDPGLALELGILTVNATGGSDPDPDITASTAFTIDWLDPDGDARISLQDLADRSSPRSVRRQLRQLVGRSRPHSDRGVDTADRVVGDGHDLAPRRQPRRRTRRRRRSIFPSSGTSPT